jgi:peroxin-12
LLCWETIANNLQRAFEAASRSLPRPGAAPLTSTSLFSAATLTRIILPRVLDSLKVLLPTSIFFLKFLEWWHASDFARQLSAKTAASIELPPPTIIPPPAKEDEVNEYGEEVAERQGRKLVKLPDDSSICPICCEELTNPTALQTGYVFCYPCIFRWVQDGEDDPGKGCCPITGVKLLGGTDGLRRIMV